MKGHFPGFAENAFSYAADRKTTGIHNKMKGKRSARRRAFARFKTGKGTCFAQPEYNKENEDRRRRGMYETIPIQQLDEWLERGYTGRIIDLRDAGAFCCGHIYGAENYPFHELMQNPSVLTAQEPLLFYCTRGSESLLACNYYARQGYQVYNVANGLSYYCGKYLTL